MRKIQNAIGKLFMDYPLETMEHTYIRNGALLLYAEMTGKRYDLDEYQGDNPDKLEVYKQRGYEEDVSKTLKVVQSLLNADWMFLNDLKDTFFTMDDVPVDSEWMIDTICYLDEEHVTKMYDWMQKRGEVK